MSQHLDDLMLKEKIRSLVGYPKDEVIWEIIEIEREKAFEQGKRYARRTRRA